MVKIKGEHRLPHPPDEIWAYLHDVDLLRATVPGCKELEQEGPSVFTGAATVGVGPIRGLYRGTLELLEENDSSDAQIRVDARSSHAEIQGEGQVNLEPDGEDGTILRYEGEARISGPLSTVGHRLLPSATRTLTESFFKNFEDALRQGRGGK